MVPQLKAITHNQNRSREKSQWPRVLTVLAEDSSAIPSIRMIAHVPVRNSQFQEIQHPPLTSTPGMHTEHVTT